MPTQTYLPAHLRRQLVAALADATATVMHPDLESVISEILGEIGGVWPDYCRDEQDRPSP